jgi:hypothetical protein
MADFRKLFLALAVVALLAGSAVTANAQAFQCVANAGVPPLLRSEGLTELVGDMVLNCDGVVDAGGITANIRIFLNTNVTSRLVNDPGSEALLMVDEPGPGQQNFWPAGSPPPLNPLYNVYQGTQTGVNTIDWLGIPIVAPGSSGSNRVYRITNVRANANQLGTSSSLIPTQVFMFISISGTTSVPVNNPQQVVGFIVPGMTFSASGAAFRQCEDPEDTVDLTFTEGFASSFKVQGPVAGGQSIPGAVYNTETGFQTDDPDAPAEIGMADQGTRFWASFTGIQSGVELTVPVTIASSQPGGQWLNLVTGHDDAGAGGSLASGSTATISVSGGVAVVVYEVVGDASAVAISTSSNEEYIIPVTTIFTSTLPGLTLTPVTVNANFAPVSTVTVASDVEPIPRFADVSTAKDAFSINACRTLLLFPYLTNAVGFDSGVAISNTSMDPFGTSPQTGACTLNYYGNYPATGAPAPSPVTTPDIAGGEQLAFVMSSGGGVVGTTNTCTGCATPGFHGYMIAICNFQYAHGFAFVSDLGAARVSEAYLALIIPDKLDLRSPDAFSRDAGSNDGEQLVH